MILGLWSSTAQAVFFDHSSYDEILRRYVDEEGRVDYASIRENSLSALESYFERMSAADQAGWPPAERFAFWINAYNARVLYEVAQKPGMKKISENFGLFNRTFKAAGLTVSANDVKHCILRGVTNPDTQRKPIPGVTMEKPDPRVHFALVGGTVDCPRLRNFAYTAENLDDTLFANTRRFANSAQHVDIVNKKLKLSSLLKWYAKDFLPVGGVAAFLIEHLTPEKRGDAEEIQDLLKRDFNKAEYRYDWTVNDQKPAEPAPPSPRVMPHNLPADASSLSN